MLEVSDHLSFELRLCFLAHMFAELLALMHFLHPERFSLATDFELGGKQS